MAEGETFGPSNAGAAIRPLGFAACAAGRIRGLGGQRPPQAYQFAYRCRPAAASAWSRSAMMSSICSMPIDSRT